jgi:dipeptidyl aminopeptidase/acylaminoacyl peptidase
MKNVVAWPNLIMTLVLWPLIVAASMGPSFAASDVSMRSPTVSDSVEMTSIGTPLSEYLGTPPATTSPDGKTFVIVARKGNVGRNSNDYALLLFHKEGVFLSPQPDVVVSFSSMSNRPGIDNVRWIGNRTVGFLGAPENEPQQIYSYDLTTRVLTKRTHSDTDIVCFDATSDFTTIVYMSRPRPTYFFDRKTLDRGLIIDQQWLPELMMGSSSDLTVGFIHAFELFVDRNGQPREQVPTPEDLPLPLWGIWLSADGAYAVAGAMTKQMPTSWIPYTDVATPGSKGTRYLLIDVQRSSARPLISGNGGSGAPGTSIFSTVVWLAESRSVVVSDVYLPLDVSNDSLRAERAKTRYTLEINADTGVLIPITTGRFDLITAQAMTQKIFLAKHSGTATRDASLAYQKIHGVWQRTNTTSERDADIVEEQDLNTPPRLFAVGLHGHERTLLLDLNPQFRNVRFGRVEAIDWKGKDGHEAKGGLYLPTDYGVGKRYPLVIQTHGWNPERFTIDGESAAGFAAQALAGKGFIVVQMDERYGDVESTEREGPMQVGLYEALIDYLDGRKLIDRTRIGLMGWSRSGFGVRYALEFSKYPIAAAAVVDGMDASYFQYMVDLPFPDGAVTETYTGIQGGDPLRGGLQKWERNATGFNLSKVKTPVRLVALGLHSVLENNWEWFAGLEHLNKPVELILLRDALHSPVRPSERITAQEGDVDWFCFWLKDEEDHNPQKAEQYARWRELRKKQALVNSDGTQ